ncbi:MAG: hypothetical protein A3J38_07870 [Gammaproteobacteria bacterium RIFCSPHIGHO2_12_FULL_45_9]|nr:MAG: hypothetical protein A3J38_07870 [Gammaproteobacteria bacterium RIFCSPHIGHO2_12_FULL_45_9]
MSDFTPLTEAMYRYVVTSGLRESSVLHALREETARAEPTGVQMLLGIDEAQVLAFLMRLMRPKRVIELGTFTGYSGIAMALAMPAGSQLTTFDVCARTVDIAKRYAHTAGVSDRIDFRIQSGLEGLIQCAAEWGSDSVDFCLIDADKASYEAYYEQCLLLLRSGGVIALDNMFAFGKILEENNAVSAMLRDLNAKIVADPRVEPVLLTVCDGLMLVYKK